MAQVHPISRLGSWEGYVVTEDWTELRAGRSVCVIRLEPSRGQPRCCSGCGAFIAAIHDLEDRRVRDLPVFEHRVELIVPRVRVACPRCGPKLERLPWLDAYARVTRRLAESVGRLCEVMAIRHVARYFGLDWKTVKELDRQRLERTLGLLDLDGIEVIAMDEFAIQKGHRYATVIVEPTRKRVLWVGRGRRPRGRSPVLRAAGTGTLPSSAAAVMDMNAGYELEVRRHCPNAAIVYDLFHVVAKYGREVVDRVRVDRANGCADKPGRKVVKGARWLLLRNRDSLRPGEDVRLDELLAANHACRGLRAARCSEGSVGLSAPRLRRAVWRSWYRGPCAAASNPLIRFAQRLRQYLPGILSHCRWPLHTSLLEGINNKIKVIKRMAYGFRDDAYFFLKIRAAFPGVGR